MAFSTEICLRLPFSEIVMGALSTSKKSLRCTQWAIPGLGVYLMAFGRPFGLPQSVNRPFLSRDIGYSSITEVTGSGVTNKIGATPRGFRCPQIAEIRPVRHHAIVYALHPELSHHARVAKTPFGLRARQGCPSTKVRTNQIAGAQLSACCRDFVNSWYQIIDSLQRIPATVRDLRERFACDSEGRRFTREGLPATNCDVDVERIELQRPCLASALVRGNDRRTRPGERIEHDVPAARAVLDGIDYERGRLHGGVHFEIGVAARAPRIDAGVVPDVGPVPSVRSKFHGVHVRIGPHLVDEDELVLGPIE